MSPAEKRPEKLRAAQTEGAAGLAGEGVEQDPLIQFGHWLEQAENAGIAEPNAMLLATVSSGISSEISGAPAPSQRSVLMKGFDEDGFVFFTNHGSRKARQMRENAAVSAVFPWYALHRQVIIEGRVGRVGEAQSLEYFHSRPRDAQLGAWASRQSETLASRRVLEERMARISERFRDREIPLPAFWGGYRIRPHRIEFWQGQTHRLHDRILYTRRDAPADKSADGSADTCPWEISRLFP